MNPQDHLQKIKAKCEELLAIAEKRTPGKWEEDTAGVFVGGKDEPLVSRNTSFRDRCFIASTAGPFEAALKSTIAAITRAQTQFQSAKEFNNAYAQGSAEVLIHAIRSAWPVELL